MDEALALWGAIALCLVILIPLIRSRASMPAHGVLAFHDFAGTPHGTVVLPPNMLTDKFARDDEFMAHECVNLMVVFSGLYSADERDDAEEIHQQLRCLGRELCRSGGTRRMMRVLEIGMRIGHKFGLRVSDFDFHWDGIGDWEY